MPIIACNCRMHIWEYPFDSMQCKSPEWADCSMYADVQARCRISQRPGAAFSSMPFVTIPDTRWPA